MNPKKPLVLVLCTGNSCRSQMAEAFLKKYMGDRFDFHSAGTRPADAVHPKAIAAMAEVGIDISHHTPKDSRQYLGHMPVRHLLIVCDKASMSCPRIWPGVMTRTYLPFEDPAHAEGTEAEQMQVFRRVRDEIGLAMQHWTPPLVNPMSADTTTA